MDQTHGKVKMEERSKLVPLHCAMQGRRVSGLHCSPDRSPGRTTTATKNRNFPIAILKGGARSKTLTILYR